MARKAQQGPRDEPEPLRLFCLSEDRPYKPAGALGAGAVVLLHGGEAGAHPAAAYAELATRLFRGAEGGAHSRLFVVDCAGLAADLEAEWGPQEGRAAKALQKSRRL